MVQDLLEGLLVHSEILLPKDHGVLVLRRLHSGPDRVDNSSVVLITMFSIGVVQASWNIFGQLKGEGEGVLSGLEVVRIVEQGEGVAEEVVLTSMDNGLIVSLVGFGCVVVPLSLLLFCELGHFLSSDDQLQLVCGK